MFIYTLHVSHFYAELGAAEERTEAYKQYVEGVPQVCDNAMQKESGQSSRLCLEACPGGEERVG